MAKRINKKEFDKQKVEKKKTENNKINWVTTLYLSFFLGFLGIDKFYMKKYIQGLFKLITFGGIGIWWIVDIILILTSYEYKGIKWNFPKNKGLHQSIILIFIVIGTIGNIIKDNSIENQNQNINNVDYSTITEGQNNNLKDNSQIKSNHEPILKVKNGDYTIKITGIEKDIIQFQQYQIRNHLFLNKTPNSIIEELKKKLKSNRYLKLHYDNTPYLKNYSKFLNEDIIFSYTLNSNEYNNKLIYWGNDIYVYIPSKNILFRERNKAYTSGGFGPIKEIFKGAGVSKSILNYDDALLIIIKNPNNCDTYWWNKDKTIIIENQTKKEITDWSFRSNINLNKIKETCGNEEVFVFRIKDILKKYPIK